MSAQFWDGRAASLEAQALAPLVNALEMGRTDHDEVVAVIQAIDGYAPMFEAAFDGPGSITIENVVGAIAAFERTLLTPNSPYDRYLAGEPNAMTAQQLEGMALFETRGCTGCHAGPLLASQGEPGEPLLKKFPKNESDAYVARYELLADTGRETVTGTAADSHRWKVPTLRNVALTAPYFHNGSVATLEEAIRVMARTQIFVELPEHEVQKLAAFLNALTGDLPSIQPVVVPASLTPERVPTVPPMLLLLAAGVLLSLHSAQRRGTNGG